MQKSKEKRKLGGRGKHRKLTKAFKFKIENKCGILQSHGYIREVVPEEGGREAVGPKLPPYLIRTDSSMGEGWTLGFQSGKRTRNKHRKQSKQSARQTRGSLSSWTLHVDFKHSLLSEDRTHVAQAPRLGHMRMYSSTANTSVSVSGGGHAISALSKIVSAHSQSKFAQEAGYQLKHCLVFSSTLILPNPVSCHPLIPHRKKNPGCPHQRGYPLSIVRLCCGTVL